MNKILYISYLIVVLLILGCASTLKDSASDGDVIETDKLLAEGKDVNEKDDRGWTPLYYALQNNHPLVAATLIENGAELNISDPEGQTPLSVAVVYSAVDTAEMLIEAGADVNVADNLSRTPLHNVALKGRPPMVALLLWHGADPNPRNKIGWTPLDNAVRYNHPEVIEVLLENGAIGYSYEVRKGFANAEHRSSPSPAAEPEGRTMEGVFEEVYDSFNEQTTLSLTYSIESLKGDHAYQQYRSILAEFSEHPEKFYQVARRGWLIGPWQTVSLVTDNELYPEVGLTFALQGAGFYFFADQPAQVKIAEKIYLADRVDSSADTEDDLVTTRAVFLLPERLIEKIRDSFSVVLRIRFEGKLSITWEVPPGVLRDWKRFFDDAASTFE